MKSLEIFLLDLRVGGPNLFVGTTQLNRQRGNHVLVAPIIAVLLIVSGVLLIGFHPKG